MERWCDYQSSAFAVVYWWPVHMMPAKRNVTDGKTAEGMFRWNHAHFLRTNRFSWLLQIIHNRRPSSSAYES